MNAILHYVKSFMILFLVLKLLIQMVPKEKFQKYIRFFAELILVFGLLCPVLRYLGEEEAFLELVEYNEFMEGLQEASMNAERITFLQNDSYVTQYEKAIESDVVLLSEQQGFTVKKAEVTLSNQYEIKKISLVITDQGNEDIVIGKIILENGTEEKKENTEEAAYQKLKEKLLSYYQLTENQLEILYE